MRACFALMFVLCACGPKDVIPEKPKPVNGEPKDVTLEAVAADEKAAYDRARPVFEARCGKCHSSSGAKATAEKLAHFSIDTYPFGGHHATEIGDKVREVLGATGKEPTMPADDPGSLKEAELEALVDWSNAFDEAHAAGLHDHGDGGHHHEGH